MSRSIATLSVSCAVALALAGCAKGAKTEARSAGSAPATEGAATGGDEIEARDEPLPIGSAAVATDVKMVAADGRTTSIQEIATDKGTLVFFTCNHCPWAKAWESRLVEIGNAALDKGIGVIAINPNDPEANAEDSLEGMKARVSATGMKFPYAVDATSDIARVYGATKTPEVFLFDGDRKLVYYGAIDDNAKAPDKIERPYLREAIDALLAGRAIPVASTKAFGCSIKFRDRS